MRTRTSLRPLLESFTGSQQGRAQSDAPAGIVGSGSQVGRAGERENVVDRTTCSVVSALFDECGSRAYSLAYRMLQGDRQRAETVVQTVFIEVSRALPNPENPDMRHLCRLTVHHVRQRCLDLLRQSDKQSQQPSSEVSEALPQAIGDAYGPRTPFQVREALAALPFEQRTAIELAYFEGRTSDEIASRTGATVHDINRRLRLGLHHLAATFSANEREKTNQ